MSPTIAEASLTPALMLRLGPKKDLLFFDNKIEVDSAPLRGTHGHTAMPSLPSSNVASLSSLGGLKVFKQQRLSAQLFQPTVYLNALLSKHRTLRDPMEVHL